MTFGNALVFVPMSVLIPFFLRHDLRVSNLLVGYAFALFGASGAIGAVIAGSVRTPRRRIRVTWTYWTIATSSALIVGVATNYYEVLIFPLIASPMMLLGNVIWESMMQKEVPRELLGRVASVDWFVSLGMAPVGLVVAGALSNAIGIRTYFVVTAIVCTLPGLYILMSRRINEIDAGRVTPAPDAAPSPATAPPAESPS